MYAVYLLFLTASVAFVAELTEVKISSNEACYVKSIKVTKTIKLFTRPHQELNLKSVISNSNYLTVLRCLYNKR